MTLEQFIELYISQKGYEGRGRIDFPSMYWQALLKLGYQVKDGLAPPLPSIADQSPAHYVLFQPKSVSAQNPTPLIIFTHDGPLQCMHNAKPEAEIAYYVTQGFAVACPNYRGGRRPYKSDDSVLTPSLQAELEGWEKKAQGKYHLVGPQDVHAVALHLRNLPTIHKDKIFLCGTGYGAMINAHLLAGVKAGQFENIYSGAQLTSGLDYPPVEQLPNNLPILISHSVKDDKTSFEDAQGFMEKMLVTQKQAREQEEKHHNQVQIFVSQLGNHQLLDQKLTKDDTQTETYQELRHYLELSTRFIHEIIDTGEFKAEPIPEQLKHLYGNEFSPAELEEQLKNLAQTQPRGMSLEELIELYILQKDYHKKNEPGKKNFTRKFHNILLQHRVGLSDELAPPLPSLPEQPQIPFVLYKPACATAEQPSPIIIHTHGGPDVHYRLTNPHAEIAYYLSQGFVVACPNYRGSKPYPSAHDEITRTELGKWEEKAKDKHHLLGPEDIHAVAMHMRTLPYVRQDKIFLRGMSFGSFINAHLLADVKAGKFENIYSGAQLTSGLDYPLPQDLPRDIPIIISHAVKDPITSFQEAWLFMRKMLFAQHLAMKQGQTRNNVQTFISEVGDHHLIDTDLTLQDKNSHSYLELSRFLEISTRFINEITQTGEFKAEAPLDQLKLNRSQPEDQAMGLVLAQSYEQVMGLNGQLSFPPEPEIKAEEKDTDDEDVFYYNEPEEKWIAPAEQKAVLSPTQAHLKLTLGEAYSGVLKQDLELFLGKHLKPRKWDNVKEVWETVGQDMLKDTEFMAQIIGMLEHEIAFLAEHPDYMVVYHAGEHAALQLYSFLTIWKNMLRGDFSASHKVLNEMRLFDFMTQSFDDINVFLLKMRQKREMAERALNKGNASSYPAHPDEEDPDIIFNRLQGFPDRALACNPGLTFNHHTTASCTLLWYFTDDRHGARLKVPCGDEIKTLLTSLGIYSNERLQRYIKHFERDQQTVLHHDKHQSVMQQAYVPYSLADEKAYLCQIWGEEFKDTPLPFDLSKPSTLQAFRQDPLAFEGLLKAHKKAFTNFGKVPGFGQDDFKYSTLLQMRYLHRPQPQVPIQTYIRQHSFFKPFWSSLEQMAREDFADFVVTGGSIPRSLVSGAESIRLGLRKQLHLRGQSPLSENALHVIFLQQKELYSGLVENPRKEVYGDVLALSGNDKIKVQERLGDLRFKGNPKTRLFQLCIYLKGYTYYDLLMEAAKTTILDKESNDPRIKEYLRKNYKMVTAYIEQFSIPDAVKTVYVPGNRYQQLRLILHKSVCQHEYDADKHQFFQENPKHPAYEDYLFGLELTSAINSFLAYAGMAKERGYGHDIGERLKRSY